MIIFGILLLIGTAMVLRGVSIDTFWDWFVSGAGAPFYQHAPDIGFWQALGLSLLIAFMTYEFNNITLEEDKDDSSTILIKAFVKLFIIYGSFWGLAIFYHSFIN